MIEQCYDRISERSQVIRPINKIDHDELLAKLYSVRSAREIMNLTIRDMKLASSCLFEGERPLADNRSFLELYLDALRSIRSRAAIKRLIQSYCVHFDPNHMEIQSIGLFLRGSISGLSGRWDLPERHQRFKLFDPAQAPRLLAELTIDSGDPRGELEKVGLTGQLLSSGLSAHVFLAALKAIQKRLETGAGVEEVGRPSVCRTFSHIGSAR
jgi:hypothetical protein